MWDNAHFQTRERQKNDESKRIATHCWDGASQRKIRVSDYSSGYCSFPSTLNLKAFEQDFSKLAQTTCGLRELSLKSSEQQAPCKTKKQYAQDQLQKSPEVGFCLSTQK